MLASDKLPAVHFTIDDFIDLVCNKILVRNDVKQANHVYGRIDSLYPGLPLSSN